MPEFVLNVQDLDESGKSYVFSVGSSWLAGSLSGARSGEDGRPQGPMASLPFRLARPVAAPRPSVPRSSPYVTPSSSAAEDSKEPG